MIFLPYESVTYHTKISPDEVIQRIQSVLDNSSRWFFTSIDHNRPYCGKVEGHTFTISRIIWYGNPFLPRITGSVKQYATETQINIKFRLHPIALLVLGVWIAILAFLNWSNYQEIGSSLDEAKVYFPLILLPLTYIILMLGFKLESRKSDHFLRDQLDAQVV
jgi:hypothetical protein